MAGPVVCFGRDAVEALAVSRVDSARATVSDAGDGAAATGQPMKAEPTGRAGTSMKAAQPAGPVAPTTEEMTMTHGTAHPPARPPAINPGHDAVWNVALLATPLLPDGGRHALGLMAEIDARCQAESWDDGVRGVQLWRLCLARVVAPLPPGLLAAGRDGCATPEALAQALERRLADAT